jgi:hypothetical protein
MTHEAAMHGMYASTGVLLLVPFLFVLFTVLWFRQTTEARARHFQKEATGRPDQGEAAEQY